MEGQTGKKLTKSTSGLRMIPTSEKFSCPFALEEPVWIPDNQVPRCTSCDRNFDFFNRRHHCRRCGKCYCDRCCSHNLLLPRMYFVDPVRHCYDCALLSKTEEDFYSKSLKILTEGSEQNIKEVISESETTKFGILGCKLSADHRSLEFSATKSSSSGIIPNPAYLNNVVGLQVITEPQQQSGKQVICGMRLKYKDNKNASVTHCIVLQTVDKNSRPWLLSAHKALEMTFESRSQTVHE